MSQEITLRAALSFAKSGRSAFADSLDVSIDMAGTKGLDTVQTVGTTEEALVLGEVPAASAHYWIKNLDATNPVDLKPATGGTVTTRILPGRVAMGQFGPSVSAPFVQATTAPVDIRVVLIQT
jgi:hypothetical protein